MTHDTSLQMTGILLGGFLSFVFIGYTILSTLEGKRPEGAFVPQKAAGGFSLVIGLLMMGAWAFLMKSGWDSFQTQKAEYSFHVLTELVSSGMLIVAGIAMMRNWSRGPALFIIANGLLLYTTVYALLAYGTTGHPLLMNGLAVLLMIVSVYMVGLVYGWGHFVLHMDESRLKE
jgi:hypothetical protein